MHLQLFLNWGEINRCGCPEKNELIRCMFCNLLCASYKLSTAKLGTMNHMSLIGWNNIATQCNYQI